jgi:transcriptional regulator with XRE-family HTH domain
MIDRVVSDEVKPLKSLREEVGLTQEQLAQMMGVSKALIGYYESGKKTPGLDKFLSMAECLNSTKTTPVSLKRLAKAFGYDTTGIPDDTAN